MLDPYGASNVPRARSLNQSLCAGLYDGAKSDLCCPRGFVLKEIELALLAYGVEIGAFENARDH